MQGFRQPALNLEVLSTAGLCHTPLPGIMSGTFIYFVYVQCTVIVGLFLPGIELPPPPPAPGSFLDSGVTHPSHGISVYFTIFHDAVFRLEEKRMEAREKKKRWYECVWSWSYTEALPSRVPLSLSSAVVSRVVEPADQVRLCCCCLLVAHFQRIGSITNPALQLASLGCGLLKKKRLSACSRRRILCCIAISRLEMQQGFKRGEGGVGGWGGAEQSDYTHAESLLSCALVKKYQAYAHMIYQSSSQS